MTTKESIRRSWISKGSGRRKKGRELLSTRDYKDELDKVAQRWVDNSTFRLQEGTRQRMPLLITTTRTHIHSRSTMLPTLGEKLCHQMHRLLSHDFSSMRLQTASRPSQQSRNLTTTGGRKRVRASMPGMV